MIERIRYMEVGCFITAAVGWGLTAFVEWDLLDRFQGALYQLFSGAWPVMLLAGLIAATVERAVVAITADRA